MGSDILEIGINTVKLIVIFLMMVQAVPILVWIERRGSAFIQMRFGPNRVGPLGLTQLLADAVKFLFKESFVPKNATKILFLSAPVLALIPAALTFTALPLSIPIEVEQFEFLGKIWGGYTFSFSGFDIDIGIIYILAVSSLGTYGILIAGWASGNKYSLLGSLRASAQMISYELSLSLSLVGILMIYATFNFYEMVNIQQVPMFANTALEYSTWFLPRWGIFLQPVGAMLFLVAMFAETNRLPFDLPETESELVAGFHTEYGGFKMLIFFMGEYGHMIVSSVLFTLLFLGGWGVPMVTESSLHAFIATYVENGTLINILKAGFFHMVLVSKVAILMWLFVWVRWTLPRFRYDKLMQFGWKTLLPLSLANVAVTAIVVFLIKTKFGG